MKKIAFLFVAMMAMTFASCNSASKGEATANGADSLAVAADTTVVVADSLVEVETPADTVVVAE